MQIDAKSEFASRLVEKILSARGADRENRGQIHASDVGRCMRQTYFKLTKTSPDEGKSADDDHINLIYKYGDAFELVMTRQMQLAGIWRDRAEVYNSDFDLTGTTDPTCEFEGKNVIVEFKGTHRQHFMVLKNKFIYGECDNYYDQIQTYLWLYPKADCAVLIVGNRDMRPKDIDEGIPEVLQGEIHRDQKWKEDNWDRLQILRTALDVTHEPPKCEFKEGAWQRNWCPWRSRCASGELTANDKAELDRISQ
jgi:hypothetical protein